MEGGSFTGDLERYIKESSGNGTSFSMYGFRKGNLEGGGVSLLRTVRDMSGKALEGEHLSLYSGSLRGTWREGSHTADSKRHVIEGSGKGAFIFYRGSVRGTERYLAREGSASMFIGQHLYWIYFCVMYNLQCCGLMLGHNTVSYT
jgi:hypothetical protein